MPSLTTMHRTVRDEPAAPSSAERFTRALVGLTRTVWHPHCTFDSAIASICEVAADALAVERVTVWHYEPNEGLLRCLHSWLAQSRIHVPANELESLSLEDDDYMAALRDVRTVDAARFDAAPASQRSHVALRSYVARHRICALLDAPAYVDGELKGVICHESVDRYRKWTAEEITFAASMGDYVAMAYEIARRRRAEDEVRHLRLHDAATGLPNREYLLELTRQRLAAPASTEDALAILYLRIDPARSGLPAPGMPTEEQVMAQLALHLRVFGSGGVDVARASGNAFALLLSRRSVQAMAVRLAERCLLTVAAIEWTHADCIPHASVGIAFAASTGCDPDELVRQAEEAAEEARAAGSDRYAIFDIVHHEVLVERLRIEHALGDALRGDGFEVHYQPEYDAAAHRWVAAEALLRWRDGERLASAGEFIGIAEASGLILPLGSLVLHRACGDAATWPQVGAFPGPGLRVNVSARQFDDPGLVEDVEAALAASGLAPGRLCLEITETTLMGNIEAASLVLRQLRTLGVKIAIDDFGTGYASLVYLKRFPVDVLKIDRSFVQGLPGDRVDAAIVSALARLAASLGIEVVAEGVETARQQLALLGLGVNRMQGWRFARAIPHQEMLRLLAAPVPASMQRSPLLPA